MSDTTGSQPLTIPGCLRAGAAETPTTEAIVDGDFRLSYAELSAEVDRFARATIAHGLRPGDRAAVWAPNSARWIIAAIGIQAAGGILVPVNTRFKGEEARYALAKVRAELLVVDDGFLGAEYLRMLRGDDPAAPSRTQPVPALPHLRTVVTVRPTDDPAALGFEEFLASGESVPQAEVDRRVAALSGDDVADILFTSGTTGYPKGAMVTHRANILVDTAWADMTGLRAGDRYLLVNPFFHSFGYRAGILTCLIRRATIVPVATFDAEDAMRVIEREKITVFPGAPTIYTTILDHPTFGDHDLSSVRLAVTGAAVVPEALLERMRQEMGFRDIITAYGLTESCGTATVCPPDTDLHRLSTSCGKAIPGSELRIAEPKSNTALPSGETGEIIVRGVNVMVGYFEDAEATAAAIDADGWLHTGDVGWMDEDGFLRITDRIKDVFMVGGFNVYPAEVERVLSGHPQVSDVAVVGVPDARMGEVGHAYVLPRPGTHPTEAELIAFCRDVMANFKVPRHITVVEALPRTPSGKVQKFRLGSPTAG